MLYGYEDWQNDWWAEYHRRMLHQYGTSLVYAALTSSELAAVEHSGFRALPALDRSLPVISSFEDDLTDDERRQLGSTLIRFRVKAGLFLKLTGKSAGARPHPARRSDQGRQRASLSRRSKSSRPR